MTRSLIGVILVIIAFLITWNFKPALASTIDPPPTSNPPPPSLDLSPIKTESKFEVKTSIQTDILPFKTVYKDDPEIEAGEEEILEEGKDGKRMKTYQLTLYEGKEYEKAISKTEVIDPVDKIIKRGTKVVWREIETSDGTIRYWKKIRVWATHYDSHCPGCDEWTAIGMKAGKGVIAVDPTLIKMRSQVYVPGYGKAVAGDTGGAIKGKIIDLGFEDARTAGWSARFVDIYLLN